MRLFSVFPNFIQEELANRRQRFGDDQEVGIQDPKATWMRMTSNFPKDDRKILMGGTLDLNDRLKFGFEELFGRDTQTGEKRRPQPTIDSIQIDEKLESLEATVEWTAYSIDQVETFFPNFLNPGRTVVVDWGWSNVPAGEIIDVSDRTQVLELFENMTPELFEEARERNETMGEREEFDLPFTNRFQHPRYRIFRRAKGRYSFAAGNITDFSFSAAGDGEWSCTTELQSISNSMIELRNRTQINRRQDSEDNKGTLQKTLLEFINQDFEGWLEQRTGDPPDPEEEAIRTNDVLLFTNNNEDVKGENLISRNDATGALEGQTYYVAWNKVEEIVNRYAQLQKEEEGVDIRLLNLDSGTSIISSLQADVIGRGIEANLNLRSRSPRVCLVNAGSTDGQVVRKLSDRSPVEEHFTDDFEIDPDRQGFLYNLYVNADLIVDAFRTRRKAFDSLMWMLNRCSAACFDIWDFEIIDDMGTYRFIDKNAIQNRSVTQITNTDDPPNPFVFRPDDATTILRDFSIDTNLDDLIKNQIVAQNAADLEGKAEEGAAWNDEIDITTQVFDDVDGEDLVLSNMDRSDDLEEEQEKAESDPLEFDFQPLVTILDGENFDPPEGQAAEDVFRAFINGTISTARGKGQVKVQLDDFVYPSDSAITNARLFDVALQSDTSSRSARNANKTANLNAQLTIDGIAGLSTYQAFQIVNIPAVLGNRGVYSIDHVTHSVDGDDWTTEIKAKYIAENVRALERPEFITVEIVPNRGDVVGLTGLDDFEVPFSQPPEEVTIDFGDVF